MAKPAIRDVWTETLEDEMQIIRELIDRFPFVALTVEYPGVVARPIGSFRSPTDYHYQTLRCNVDLMNAVQIGLTLSDADGNLPPGYGTWNFNLHYDSRKEMYSQESYDQLTKAGVDFSKHAKSGIKIENLGELLLTSGVVLCSDVRWISFRGGYDFAYLIKVLSCQPLPVEEAEFFELVRIYCPAVYDVKSLMKSCDQLKGGLAQLADHLGIERVGPVHQAGSESLLSAASFFKMRQIFFENRIDDTRYLGPLTGLGLLAAQ